MKTHPITRCLAALLLTCAAARADFQNGQIASLALGDLAPNQGFLSPSGVAVDPVTHKVFVSDRDKNRVLRFSSMESLKNGGVAEFVLGQADLFDNVSGTTNARLKQPSAVAVDASSGNLWVGDTLNHRVLLFINAASRPNGSEADHVLGQATFLTGMAGLAANRMNNVTSLAAAGGVLWVGDRVNNRVLRFDNAAAKSNGANANGVLGQALFTINSGNSGPDRLSHPDGLALDNGQLWIADSGFQRVVRHQSAAGKPNGSNAESAIGQLTLTTSYSGTQAHLLGASPGGITIDPVTGKIFLCDTSNHRVLRFASGPALVTGASAELAFGQADLQSNSLKVAGQGLDSPEAVAMDHLGHLWIADTGNNRVLRIDNAASVSSGSIHAGVVLGQANIADNLATIGQGRMNHPSGLAVGSTFNRTTQLWTTNTLWVADTTNNRVLRFSAPLFNGDGMIADGVLGQSHYFSGVAGSAANQANSPQGLTVDDTGHLWVADTLNNRVLRFDEASNKPSGAAANGLLLQLVFGSVNHQGPTASLGINPTGVCVSPQGRLFVTQSYGRRAVWFDDAANLPNGAPANGLLGANDLNDGNSFTPGHWRELKLPSTCCLDAVGRLWVVDSGHARVLRFTPALDSTITGTGLNAQKKFTLTMRALGGETYELHSSPDLQDWSTTEATFRATIGLPYSVLNWTAPTVATGQRFYRLQAP